MIRIVSLCLIFALGLSGCGLNKESLGLKRTSSDAAAVEVRQPLDLPPDFDKLPD